MCTRYYVELSPELRPYIEAANSSPLKDKMVSRLGKPFQTEGEIKPTAMTTVIASSADRRIKAFPMIWGYHIDGISHPVLNARMESAQNKKSFATDWKKHRCIIPASYYFEWMHIKAPDGSVTRGSKYAIQPRNAHVTWLAGLYRVEQSQGIRYPVFVILTRTPPEELLKIHDRMPLILPASAMADWINPLSDPASVAKEGLTDMVCEKVGS